MSKKQLDRRKAALKKETLRKLDHAVLTPDALQLVAGGGRKVTCPCDTFL